MATQQIPRFYLIQVFTVGQTNEHLYIHLYVDGPRILEFVQRFPPPPDHFVATDRVDVSKLANVSFWVIDPIRCVFQHIEANLHFLDSLHYIVTNLDLHFSSEEPY